MNTDNNAPITTSPETTNSVLSDIQSTIKDLIQNSGARIKQAFVDSQVNAEVSRRTGLLTSLVLALTKFKNEIRRFDKPDNVTYNLSGEIASQSYTKATLDARKKALEKLAKAEKILADAINNNDYSKVEQTTKELANVGGNDKTDGESQ